MSWIWSFTRFREGIDGETFTHLTRQDIASIFTSADKFILASKLYKVIKQARTSQLSTNELLSDLEDDSTIQSTPKHGSSSRQSLSSMQSLSSGRCLSSSRSTSSRKRPGSTPPMPIKKRCSESTSNETAPFKLPTFSPDIQQCISKDGFYTSTQRNRLIKEACTALRGYCWEQGEPVSNIRKRDLAKMLYDLAPKSLGDPRTDKRDLRLIVVVTWLWWLCVCVCVVH